MKDDISNKTRLLIRQLNYFILHVILYSLSNIGMVIFAFGDIDKRWWIFFFVFTWAGAMLYHALRVYGIDFLNRKNKKLNAFWSYFLKLSGS